MRIIINIEKAYIFFDSEKGGQGLDEPVETKPIEPKGSPKPEKTTKKWGRPRKEESNLTPKQRKLLKSFQNTKQAIGLEPFND